jgi:hypothetical protein
MVPAAFHFGRLEFSFHERSTQTWPKGSRRLAEFAP